MRKVLIRQDRVILKRSSGQDRIPSFSFPTKPTLSEWKWNKVGKAIDQIAARWKFSHQGGKNRWGKFGGNNTCTISQSNQTCWFLLWRSRQQFLHFIFLPSNWIPTFHLPVCFTFIPFASILCMWPLLGLVFSYSYFPISIKGSQRSKLDYTW